MTDAPLAQEPRARHRPVLRAHRLAGLVRKESLQVVRDPSSILIAFILPVVLLLLFGFGVSLDADRIDLALVVENPTGETESLVASFGNSRYFNVALYRHRKPAREALVAGRVRAVVVLRQDFSGELIAGEPAPVQVLLDGTHANTSRIAAGYAAGVWANWLQQEAEAAGRPARVPVAAETRVWFNPELRSRNFLVPGLIAVIMTLTGTLLTALVVAREWERGTMEALMATPLSVAELLLGKLIPYFLLGMGGMLLTVLMAVFVFGVPIRGSFAVLAAAAAVFMVGALAMGLLISTIARNQFVAGQIAIFTAFLPAFMLSGFLFEIGSTPWPIQWISHAVPARYFIAILQSLFLAGDVWSVILPNLAAMAGIAAIFVTATLAVTRRRLF